MIPLAEYIIIVLLYTRKHFSFNFYYSKLTVNDTAAREESRGHRVRKTICVILRHGGKTTVRMFQFTWNVWFLSMTLTIHWKYHCHSFPSVFHAIPIGIHYLNLFCQYQNIKVDVSSLMHWTSLSVCISVRRRKSCIKLCESSKTGGRT